MLFVGALNVKHKMQVRTLRQTHVDSDYYKVLFKYFKGITTELADAVYETNPGMIVRFISMDDKSKVTMGFSIKVIIAFIHVEIF